MICFLWVCVIMQDFTLLLSIFQEFHQVLCSAKHSVQSIYCSKGDIQATAQQLHLTELWADVPKVKGTLSYHCVKPSVLQPSSIYLSFVSNKVDLTQLVSFQPNAKSIKTIKVVDEPDSEDSDHDLDSPPSLTLEVTQTTVSKGVLEGGMGEGEGGVSGKGVGGGGVGQEVSSTPKRAALAIERATPVKSPPRLVCQLFPSPSKPNTGFKPSKSMTDLTPVQVANQTGPAPGQASKTGPVRSNAHSTAKTHGVHVHSGLVADARRTMINAQVNIEKSKLYAVYYDSGYFVGSVMDIVQVGSEQKIKMKFLKKGLAEYSLGTKYMYPSKPEIEFIDPKFIFWGPIKVDKPPPCFIEIAEIGKAFQLLKEADVMAD
jgi:hypothetical protein